MDDETIAPNGADSNARLCEYCATRFTPTPRQIKLGAGRFCSRPCGARGRKSWRGSTEDRFWSKVDKSGACWLWTAAQTPSGDGLFHVTTSDTQTAHHYSARLHGLFTEDNAGRFLERTCDQRLCVRPDHLRVRRPETDEELRDRFWRHVEKSGPVPPHRPELGACWEWTGFCDPYGSLSVGSQATGTLRTIRSHVLSWRLHFGEPGELHVCHRCDNTRCVRPEHLFLGTAADNHDDMKRKGRSAHGERHGSARLTETLVRQIRASSDTQQALADRFGVSRQTIGEIRRGEIWRHVL